MLVAVGTRVHVPFAALGPGPTVNTLSDIDGTPVVQVDGTDTDPVVGNLNMTTVEVRSALTLFDALGFWASGRYGVVPIDEVIPRGRTQDEVRESNRADFARSERSAERAALLFLDYPTVAVVDSVGEDGAASGLLEPGDRILAVDGEPVATGTEVVDRMQGKRPGDSVVVTYSRGAASPQEDEAPGGPGGVDGSVPGEEPGEQAEVVIELRAHPEEPERGVLGILVGTDPVADFTVTFNLADVGGPSAGLMFALALVDKLTPGALNGGRFVAGTGTIDAAGNVGAIGGVRYKTVAAREAGATEFLVPAENCAEAARHAPDGLTLLRVGTLTEAVDALAAVAAGEEAPTC